MESNRANFGVAQVFNRIVEIFVEIDRGGSQTPDISNRFTCLH
jgi:hypothetical protein